MRRESKHNEIFKRLGLPDISISGKYLQKPTIFKLQGRTIYLYYL